MILLKLSLQKRFIDNRYCKLILGQNSHRFLLTQLIQILPQAFVISKVFLKWVDLV